MPELNRTQFAGTLHGIHPHQQALPGMEHLAHPWAGPLSRGYMLDYGTSDKEHHLAAVDVADPKWPMTAAELDWGRSHADVPGKVAMVQNYQRAHRKGQMADPRSKGLAGAMFHAAHYWDFGQETVPVHSPVRSPEGEHFASKVRPDLKPDVWHDYINNVVHRPPDKPRGEPAIWHGVQENLHPFQQKEAERHSAQMARLARQRPTDQVRMQI